MRLTESGFGSLITPAPGPKSKVWYNKSMANSFKDLNPENKLQRGIRNAVRNIGMPGEPIRFVLSTERVARDGHVIAASAWDLTNFRRNNPCLWAHDDTALPIGRWENLAVENMPAGDPALFGDLHFASQEYEFAATVEKLYHSGALNAVSVRWSPRAYEPLNDGQGGLRFTDVDLLEVSAVPVPADPDALMVAAQRGIVTNDELVRFETKLGVPGVTILGSETIMEEQAMEEVADEQDAERAGGIKANIPLAKEQPSAEDAGDPIEPVTDDQPTDCTVGDDGECIDTNDCPNGDCAASGDEVLVEPTVTASGVDVPALGGEDPVIEEGRAFDDFDEFERIGKKFSKKNADQIRQAIDALGFAQEALREMIEEEESPMAKATPEANERDVEEEDILGDAEREAHAEDAARSVEARNAEEADKLEYINAIEEDLARILGGEKEPDVALETGAIGDLITQVRNML